MPTAGPETCLKVLEGLLERRGVLWLTVGAKTLTAEAPGKYVFLFHFVLLLFYLFLFF